MLRAVHIARVILQVYWTKGSHMRRLSLRTVVAVTVPAFLATPAALAQGYDDAPAAIALFSEENFYGDVRDVYDPFTSMNDLAFNDRTRSIAVFAGHESGLDPAFAEKIIAFIVAEVIRHHEQIRGREAE